MCSFMELKCPISEVERNLEPMREILNVKGGDETEVVLIIGNTFTTRIRTDIALIDTIKDKLKTFNLSMNVQIIAFSRLTPEMEESNNTLHQPYYNMAANSIVVVHGTIPHAEMIAKKYKLNISVDTEIFNFLDFDTACAEVEKVGGKISAMSVSIETGKKKYYNNGLGLFQFNYKGPNTTIRDYAANINFDTNIDCRKLEKYNFTLQKEYNMEKPDTTRVVSLFSGGLDITCATQRVIYDLIREDTTIIKSIDLWYFDWSTNAREEEIKAGEKASLKLYNQYNIPTNFNVLEISNMFKDILNICEVESVRLTDSTVEGAGSHEAEAAISYVPYRNTFLMTLAAARAEQLYPGENVKFVIGANLSEGMIYLDNSETWLTHMNNLIKVGGQSCINFEVVAPYVNRTKTEMVKDAKSKIFFLDSFSCYFPNEDGTPCGKCGSCLLKENALKRSK